jgi:tripartite ATP-independent transporter DctM subunit
LKTLLDRLERAGRFAENTALVVLIATMIGVSVFQIINRQLLGGSFSMSWADELVKIIVLWLAMVGSIAACRDNKHIRIDLITHILSGPVVAWIKIVVDIFAAAVCAMIGWQAYRLVREEAGWGDMVLTDIPLWLVHAIVPVPVRARARRGRVMIIVSVLLVILAILGAPLFAIIATSAMVGFHSNETELMTIALELMSIAQMPVLTAIPLFTFAGYLLSESDAPKRLVRLTSAMFGWMPGGLALVCLAACAFFTAFTGASGVTIIALGAILYPALKQDGYGDRFNLGLVTSSGSLGLLFAPSLPIILYGVVAKVSIDDLFRAGILPGLLMLFMLGGYSIWVNRENRKPLSAFSWGEVGKALREAIWELPLPFVVLGGIYSGFFAVSEAAAITAMYVFITEVLIYREIAIRNLPRVIRESMVLVGAILMILGVSLASTYYMIDAEVPQKLLGLVAELVSSPTDTGYFLGHCACGAANPADSGGFRCQRGAPRHRIPGGHATGLPDTTCRAQSVYREFPLRETDHACVFGDMITFWPTLSLLFV